MKLPYSDSEAGVFTNATDPEEIVCFFATPVIE